MRLLRSSSTTSTIAIAALDMLALLAASVAGVAAELIDDDLPTLIASQLSLLSFFLLLPFYCNRFCFLSSSLLITSAFASRLRQTTTHTSTCFSNFEVVFFSIFLVQMSLTLLYDCTALFVLLMHCCRRCQRRLHTRLMV